MAHEDRQGALEADLARLAGLDLPALRQRWRRVVGRGVPDHLPASLLRRVLAYRVQAAAYGDLPPTTIKLLERLGSEAGAEVGPPPAERGHRAGTVLVREWRGSLHHVTVLRDGFSWNGQSYDSLSRVARAITGTNWNGPRFFGLRAKRDPLGKPAASHRSAKLPIPPVGTDAR